MQNQRIAELVRLLEGPEQEEAFRHSDELAKIGSEEMVQSVIPLLMNTDEDVRYLAARTLAKTKNNQQALPALLAAIEHHKQNGGLVEALDGFDVSKIFVEIFKIYLNGTFKASAMAKMLLDYKEFDITQRVLKKAEKHWNHYVHNVRHDEKFENKRMEVESLLQDLRTLLEE